MKNELSDNKYSFYVYAVAALVSLLFSTWISIYNVPPVNTDGICFLRSAEAYSQGWQIAMHLCEQAIWPFYSMLIYGVAQLTHASYETAACLLNALFSLASTLLFIAIVDESIRSFSYQKQRINLLGLAALVILSAHQINAVKHNIIRDHGYWACYLLSFWLLLRYLRLEKLKYALLWSLSLIGATLFREEGIIFLSMVPCVVFLKRERPWSCRIKAFFQLQAIALILGMITLVWCGFHRQEVLQFVHDSMSGRAGAQLVKIQNSADYQAISGKVLSLPMWVITKSYHFISEYCLDVLDTISWIYVALIIYAWRKHLHYLAHPIRQTLMVYILINLLFTYYFWVHFLFLSKRYLITLALMFLLWVPLALNDLINQWRVRQWPLVLVAIGILISGVGGIVEFGYSKKYIVQAGQWIANNIPPHVTLYSNSSQVLYYANRSNDISQMTPHTLEEVTEAELKQWRSADYIALLTTKDKWEFILNHQRMTEFSPVLSFSNKRGDEVVIYKHFIGKH